MLVLTRNRGEKIFLGDDIVIEVVEFVGQTKVRLGITAPPTLAIHRDDIVHTEPHGPKRIARTRGEK